MMEGKKTDVRLGRTKGKGEDDLDWHAAFREAIELDFEDYKDVLSFEFEHNLTTQPLRIDALIIKKSPGAVITKNLGKIFKDFNVLEYKNPDDYFSVKDYYKSLAYVYLYIALDKKANIGNITLSIVESRKPVELIKHLEGHGLKATMEKAGIYKVEGAGFPVQIIINLELSKADSLWLRNLRKGLDTEDAMQVLDKLNDKEKLAQALAYLEVLMKANVSTIKGVINMKYPTIEEILADTIPGKKLIDRSRAQGISQGVSQGEQKVLSLLKQGYTVDAIEKMLNQQSNEAGTKQAKPTA
jgi:hypothetical protein